MSQQLFIDRSYKVFSRAHSLTILSGYILLVCSIAGLTSGIDPNNTYPNLSMKIILFALTLFVGTVGISVRKQIKIGTLNIISGWKKKIITGLCVIFFAIQMGLISAVYMDKYPKLKKCSKTMQENQLSIPTWLFVILFGVQLLLILSYLPQNFIKTNNSFSTMGLGFILCSILSSGMLSWILKVLNNEPTDDCLLDL